MDFKNKRIAIIGIARSGIAAAQKIKILDGRPFLSDEKPLNKLNINPKILDGFDNETGGHTDKILHSELIIISPGVSTDIPVLKQAKQKGIPIWSELELGYQIAKRTKAKIIAVTGSNGKSTTATLIYHILKNARRKAILAGNIGKAFTSFLLPCPDISGINQNDFIVLEVSSFQLDTIFKFKPDISIILNITPDHLDRYHNFAEYVKSKSKILVNQTKSELAILNYDDAICRDIAGKFKARKEFFSVSDLINPRVFVRKGTLCLHFPGQSERIIGFDRLPIRGLHNISNISAAVLACWHCGLSVEELAEGILSFSGLEHRLEPVTEINGVKFINDSKATNSASVKAALQSFDTPINLIMGGSNKNEDFSSLIPYLKKYVRNLVLFGETKDILHQAFSGVLPPYVVNNLGEAIKKAFSVAEKGDYVLLSPGYASFDMFENFEDRGKKFKKLVLTLKKKYEDTNKVN
jgi:UDP-N-acetylmuramoylalanine--D-glutamate ligase